MSLIDKLLEDKNHKLNELQLAEALNNNELRSNIDPTTRARLEIRGQQLGEEINQLLADIAQLDLGSLPQRSAEEQQQRIITAWSNNQHHIDYTTPLNNVTPILQQIGGEDWGTAIFLVPETNRMRGTWLVKRMKEWTEMQQKAKFTLRQLKFLRLDQTYVLTELSALFGIPPQLSEAEVLKAVAEAIFDQLCEDNSVLALQITLPGSISAELFCHYLPLFLGYIWKALVESQPTSTRDRAFLRLVLFILTDLPSHKMNDEISIEAPAFDCNKCTLVKIAPWQKKDINEWLVNFSTLRQIGLQREELQTMAADAMAADEGVPLGTWAYLEEAMKEALTTKLKELQHG